MRKSKLHVVELTANLRLVCCSAMCFSLLSVLFAGPIEAFQEPEPPPPPEPTPAPQPNDPDVESNLLNGERNSANRQRKPLSANNTRVLRFELKAEGMPNSSLVALTDKTLTIRSPDGSQHKYQRLERYDTEDGAFISYSSRELQQIIRWPTSGQGPMEIGTLRQGVIQFLPSRMQVTKVGVPLPPQHETSPIPGIDPLQPGLLPTPPVVINPGSPPGNVAMPGGGLQPKLTPLAFSNGAAVGNYLVFEGTDRRNEIRIRLEPNPLGNEATWFINPVANGSVRIQVRENNRWYALAPIIDSAPNTILRNGADARGLPAADPSIGVPQLARPPQFRPPANQPPVARPPIAKPPVARPPIGIVPPPRPPHNARPPHNGGGHPHHWEHVPVGLQPLAPDRAQIWRVIPGDHYGFKGAYIVENALMPGYCLAMPHLGPMRARLCLEPITFDPWQIWYPAEPVYEVPVPLYETRHHELVANPPLEPAEILLENDHTDELLIVITDRRKPTTPTKIRIPSGESQAIRIDRDSGSQIQETVAFTDALGNWTEEKYATDVPPQAYYEISVYEIFLQSIAIDRTGTSPDPIEDINFQPRGVGMFVVPPGESMMDGSVIPAFSLAEQQNNAGAVRRLTDRELNLNAPRKAKDPLKEILNQFQKPQAAF